MATKTPKTLLTSQTLLPGASVDIAEWNMTTAYAGSLFIKITNGAAAPTTAPTVKFYAGEATGIKRQRYTVSGDTVNGSSIDIECEYALQHMFANAKITNGATNPITVEAYGQEASTI